MNTKMNTKMSSEDMERALSAGASRESDLYADNEADELKQMFAALRENSLTTAERHHSLAQSTARRATSAKTNRFVWAGTLAAIAVLAAVPLEVHHRREVKVEEDRARVDAIRKEQVDQSTDEALLMNVQNDLSSSVAQPLAPLSVKFVSTSTGNTKGTNE